MSLATTMRRLDVLTAAPPMPSWTGRRVEWEPWRDAIVPLCPSTQQELACRACGSLAPSLLTIGTVHPSPGDLWVDTATGVVADAHPLRQLAAHGCPDCGDLTIGTFTGDLTVDVIECDGCDRVCAAGATLEEARATLTAAGGIGALGGEDYDLCFGCNPSNAVPTT